MSRHPLGQARSPRRLAAAIALTALAALLAGCSGGASAPPPATEQNPITNPDQSAFASYHQAPSAKAAAEGVKDDVCSATVPSEATGGTVQVEHARGVTEVPADAKRIVVLDSDKLDSLCALGLQDRIVGTATGTDGAPPSYLGPTIAKIPSVGPFATPNLEQIAGLEPDLIIGTNFRQEKFYDQLAAIAPTVFTANVGKTWKENVLLDGKAVARGEAAAKLMADYDGATATMKSKVDAARTLSVTRFMGEDLRVYGPDSFVGQVLADSGVSRPEPQQLNGKEDRRFTKVSTEDLSVTDGQLMAVCAYGQAGRDKAAEVMGSPLWSNQQVVKSGNVWSVSDAVWMTGIGVVGAKGVLTDLDEMLG